MLKKVEKTIALAGLGNGIIDIIVNVEESFLNDNKLQKGSMLLQALNGYQALEFQLYQVIIYNLLVVVLLAIQL